MYINGHGAMRRLKLTPYVLLCVLCYILYTEAFPYSETHKRLSLRQQKLVKGLVCVIKDIPFQSCLQDDEISRIADIVIRKVQSSDDISSSQLEDFLLSTEMRSKKKSGRSNFYGDW
ncbi:uncharacterized protein LOC106154976 isoform X2 [Lingula anatina]|uniref:Uncharacterized protein LOC106154976 isoform X2 n=1 Tax=Lingula anatina TaxID=7574 RepID=A0A1S3HJ34_LINAN|nr:uncharacterized protein LOC106154976 isoform X2 [Lingula anatina]|eukprot:XP_013385004.1 uncharacterized protein LOC106154976 isoform X2 [Lingula anatina]